jgi:hypothetical protein
MRSEDRYDILQEKEIAHAFKTWCMERLQLDQDEAGTMSNLFADVIRKPPLVASVDSMPTQIDAPSQEMLDTTVNAASSDSSEDPDPDAWFLSKNRPTNTFLIIRSAKGARLHKSDGCWTARYRAVKHPEICQVEPTQSDYDYRCRLCWPTGLLNEASSQESSAEDTLDALAPPPLVPGEIHWPEEELDPDGTSPWSIELNHDASYSIHSF